MEAKEFEQEIIAIGDEARVKRSRLAKLFAIANNPYKIGDIVSDGFNTIQITEIKIHWASYALPCCLYIGPKMTAKGTPYKSGVIGSVYQRNIKGKEHDQNSSVRPGE